MVSGSARPGTWVGWTPESIPNHSTQKISSEVPTPTQVCLTLKQIGFSLPCFQVINTSLRELLIQVV